MPITCLPTKSEIVKCTHGISSFYYPIGNKGIKFFQNRAERNYSKEYQNLAFLAGLAPETFENVYSDGFWGYVTESVQMLHSLYTFEQLPNKYHKMISNLCDDVYDAIYFTTDQNYRNFGIKNNKLVLVDFGYSSEYSY